MSALPIVDAHRSLEEGHGSNGVDDGSSQHPNALVSSVSHEQRGAGDAAISVLAEALDDLERARIAFENRARSLMQADAGPLAEQAQTVADGLRAIEHGATLSLKRAMRQHPLGAWVKETIGVGEKQAARLLAAIGDPAWNTLHDRPRTLRELYAFCGLHVLDSPNLSAQARRISASQGSATTAHGRTERHAVRGGVAPSRTRGQQANWSTPAKMRVYVIAESCLKAKARSPYGPVYDAARAKYAAATHNVDCRRCGPKGKPAVAGSPLNAGHQHGRAMRLVMKAVLRDLWIAARDAHGTFEGQLAHGERAATSATTVQVDPGSQVPIGGVAL